MSIVWLKKVGQFTTIEFIDSRLVYESNSDGSKDVDLVSQQVVLKDTRFDRMSGPLRRNVFTQILEPVTQSRREGTLQAEVIWFEFFPIMNTRFDLETRFDPTHQFESSHAHVCLIPSLSMILVPPKESIKYLMKSLTTDEMAANLLYCKIRCTTDQRLISPVSPSFSTTCAC